MPEWPEVETVRRTLSEILCGARITSIELLRSDIVHGQTTLLKGDTLSNINRHGKQLALVGRSGACVCIHLGMSGRLCVDPTPWPTHTHIVWHLQTAQGKRCRLVFADPRRFGGVWGFASREELADQRWSKLGPDAMRIRPADLHRRLTHTQRGLKATLLDQSVLAGLGNIYADELLWMTRLHPSRPASTLLIEDARRLVSAMRRLLGQAVEQGGSSLRDYVDGQGRPGGFQRHHRAYGRAGQPCQRCKFSLLSVPLAGRTTTWCPQCQR
jgi:formamidopyrimidine-DNA glycosylase